jgi:hypothetical protein
MLYILLLMFFLLRLLELSVETESDFGNKLIGIYLMPQAAEIRALGDKGQGYYIIWEDLGLEEQEELRRLLVGKNKLA